MPPTLVGYNSTLYRSNDGYKYAEANITSRHNNTYEGVFTLNESIRIDEINILKRYECITMDCDQDAKIEVKFTTSSDVSITSVYLMNLANNALMFNLFYANQKWSAYYREIDMVGNFSLMV